MEVGTNQDSCREVHLTTMLMQKYVKKKKSMCQLLGKQEGGLCGGDNTQLIHASA